MISSHRNIAPAALSLVLGVMAFCGPLSLSPAAAADSAGPERPTVHARSTTLESLQKAAPPAQPWGWSQPALPGSPPDFLKSAPETRGTPARPAACREATVILGTPDGGFGSGVVIAPDGWILTNYHVAASAAQLAAVSGEPAGLRVFRGELREGRMQLSPDSLVARVYRVNPAIDLALLRIEDASTRQTFPHVKIAQHPLETGNDCFVIGSQGAGFPWLLRSGRILGLFDYPLGITELMIGADSEGANIERTRLAIAVSDCPISPGDSGGPLLNAEGELAGLTFATPANLSGGAIGLHVSLQEIQRFLQSMPMQPEGIPFDPWVAGLPATVHAQPQAGIVHDAGKPCFVLQYVSLSPTHQPVANLVFFDFRARNEVTVVGADTLLSVIPAGLWGMEQRGNFTFDVFVARRFDGVTAMGFTGPDHVVSEVRIDRNQDGTAEIVWSREENGRWTAETAPAPLLVPGRLGEREVRMLTSALAGSGSQN